MKKLPFFLPFGGCKGRCVYCNQRTITGISVMPTPNDVAEALSHEEEPVEVCYFGGSFCRLGYDNLKRYLDVVVDNGCTGNKIRFSTYPGDLMDKEIRDLVLSYPISRVELGVPSLDTKVLLECKRDADPLAILDNIKLLKDLDVPLALQVMIGLPGQTEESSLSDINILAEIKGNLPWEMRLYPCLVIRNTELENMMLSGEYTPLTLSQAISWGGRLLKLATNHGFVIIRAGLQESELLANEVVGGPHHPALGELMFSYSMAVALVEESPQGPWFVDRKDISKFTGHSGSGIKRLAEFSGFTVEEVKSKLNFI
ncbi:MAG: radical SAM protein [Synergistaceae bacterium]